MFLENVEKLCKKKGMSLSGLARAIGKSPGAAAKWKRGAIPHPTTLQSIADYFGVSIEGLFTELASIGVTSPVDPANQIILTREEVEGVKFLRTLPIQKQVQALHYIYELAKEEGLA